MEVETQIRGVDGVTIVKSVPESKRSLTPTSEYTVFDLKFEILGAMNRVQYRDEILFPAFRQIPGINIVDWSPIHRTNVRGTIRTVRENKILKEFDITNYGGVAGAMAGQGRAYGTPLKTPREPLQSALEDWMQGGVKMYDTHTDVTDMAYSVMLPVEELWKYCSRMYRGDKRDFDGRYKHFISDGPDAPVFVALGQNGRIRITGNEDVIWFAKKSGLEEVPVFISYQKQV